MPSLSQSLFWIYIHTEANLSVLSGKPINIWSPPNKTEIQNILKANWYDFHQIYTLTFLVNPVEEDNEPKFPLILSFFFLTPQWYLVTEFDTIIKSCWEKALLQKKPSIVSNLNNAPTASSWFLLKQNDPDLLRLILSRVIQNKIFIPPFTRFILTPLGVTPPIIKPNFFTPSPLNLDPTSSSKVKKGHIIQKLCNSSGFLTRLKINLILSDKIG